MMAVTYQDLPRIWGERQELRERVEAIQATAKSENRDLTEKEAEQTKKLLAKHKELGIAQLEGEADEQRVKASVISKAMAERSPAPLWSGIGPNPHGRHRTVTTGGLEFRDAASGQLMNVVGPSQPLARTDHGGPRPGEVIRAMITGRLDSDIQAAAIGGSDSAGGYLLSPTVSTRLVDLARAASVAIRAGASTMEMESPEVRILTVSSDPSPTWTPEATAVTASEPAFSAITLRAKSLKCLVPISVELAEDSTNAIPIIEQTIAGRMAEMLDAAALTGAGAANEPLGVRNHTGVNTTASVGTPTNYDEITTGVQNLLTSNFDGQVSDLAWVAHPRDWATYDGLKTGISSDNSPLPPTPWASQLRRFSTTSLSIVEGAGSNESSMVVGDFRQLLIGTRTSITVRILDAGTATDSSSNTVNAASQFMKWIAVHQRVDTALLRPTWFNVLTGVTA